MIRHTATRSTVFIVLVVSTCLANVLQGQVTLIPTDDAYVAENHGSSSHNGVAMNARTELDNDRNDIIYLRFDLSEVSEPVVSAELNLTWYRDVNVDHLSLIYYGLNETADREDEWTEFDLTYEFAPGLIPDGVTTIDEFNAGASVEETQDLDLDSLTFLGRRDLVDFLDDDDIEGQVVRFSSPALADFLIDEDMDGVTLLVLRDWHNSGTQMRFATKESVDLETDLGEEEGQFAPTLVITTRFGLFGDFDHSGALDLADINMLTDVVAKATHEASFDLNDDGLVNGVDIGVWTGELAVVWRGDANLDGVFDSDDLILTFSTGKYDSGEPANWSDGDWDGDGTFDADDLIVAFAEGGYDQGPRLPALAVAEPHGVTVIGVGLAMLLARRRGGTRTVCRWSWMTTDI